MGGVAILVSSGGGCDDRSQGIEVGSTEERFELEGGSCGEGPRDGRGNILNSALISIGCVRWSSSLTENEEGGEVETSNAIDARNRSGSGEGTVGWTSGDSGGSGRAPKLKGGWPVCPLNPLVCVIGNEDIWELKTGVARANE